MEKIRIITDSGSDLLQNALPGITVLPMAVRFGSTEYRDGINLSPAEFYEKLTESDTLPQTSLISPAVFADAFGEAVAQGETVVAVTISGALSGTYQSAVLAAEEFPGKVFVVDSRLVAAGEQALVLRARQLADSGCSAAEAAAKLEAEKGDIHILALLDTLEYLQKGGRISKGVAFVGGMLSIKPVVSMRDGEVALIGKARGSRNGNNYLMQEIAKTSGLDFSRPLCLGYTGTEDSLLQKYIADSRALWEGHEDALRISHIGPTIGTHVGPGAIAVAFFTK